MGIYIRSPKYHLSHIINGNVLSFNEYCTLFTRIEAILNSRPLCSSVKQGEDVITPGHFLIGQPLHSSLELEVNNGSKILSKRLFELNNRLRSFWKVWQTDYLSQLQRWYKWQRSKPNVQVGPIVLVRDELPPYQWPLAVVQQVYPDSDGIVRVVDLKMSNSSNLLKRSIVKLVLLPVDSVSEPLQGSAGEHV